MWSTGTCSDANLVVYDMQHQEVAPLLACGGSLAMACFSLDGQIVLACGRDNQVQVAWAWVWVCKLTPPAG